MISIYTDGACSGNPGIGGWGVVIIYNNENPIFLNGGSQNTTNNRMELTAAINSILYFKEKKDLNIYTDSKYLKDGIESWIYKWKNNGWKTASKKPVANQDLWRMLDEAVSRHRITWHWVEGHAGNELNERCDQLARGAAESIA